MPYYSVLTTHCISLFIIIIIITFIIIIIIIMYLQRFVELLDSFVNVITLWLTDKDVALRNLGESARAIFFVREDGTATDDTRRRSSLLSGAADDLLLVEQPCRNMVKLRRVDEVRTVNERFTTSEHTHRKTSLSPRPQVHRRSYNLNFQRMNECINQSINLYGAKNSKSY